MPGTTSPRPAPPGLSDLLSLFGSNNPLAAMSRSAEQFRSAVTSFVEVVQSFRQTMDNLNAVALRMNRMLDDLEEPVRTVMPQITKSAETASRMLATMREPVERVAPALTQLADTMNNPLMTDLPRRMTETMDVLSSIPRALSPLGQVADLAGGFFGARGLGAFSGAGRTSQSSSRVSEPPVVVEAVVVEEIDQPVRGGAPRRTTHTAPSAQDTFRRSAARHPAARQPTPAKRTAATKATKRSTAKAAATKEPAKRTAAKKAAPRKTAAKRAAPRKASVSRSTRSTARR
jgi:DNA-binding protein HU-beta